MNLLKSTESRLFDSARPIFLFMTGLSLCVLVRILNIYWMICGFPDSNYYISKIHYVYFCEAFFLGFIILGLVSLFGSKRKVFSIALIITCLVGSINVIMTKNILATGHRLTIDLLEEAIERNGYEADKEWYRVVVRQWNDVQENKYEPVY